MGQLLRHIAAFLGLISPISYAYPALDINLPGGRQLHLVGSIHMGTVDMAPLPTRLIMRLKQAAKSQHIRVIELEGAQQQYAMLEQLPRGGIALLRDTLEHWHTNARLLQTMISWWLNVKPSGAWDTLPTTFSTELYDMLVHQRNQDWRQKLETLPTGNYVVAVGALHLYGENNLPAMLQPRQ